MKPAVRPAEGGTERSEVVPEGASFEPCGSPRNNLEIK